MSAHGFKSVYTVGAIAGTALACYLINLHVASERAALESVENRIVLAQRDIRMLNTEVGTRGRLAQLERWNVKVIRLSAPSAEQFVDSTFQLATLAKPDAKPALEAPVVFASAPAPARREPLVTNDDGSEPAPVRASRPVADMMHIAGYANPEPKSLGAATKPSGSKVASLAKPVASIAKPKSAAAVKPVKTATADPLGPLSGVARAAKSDTAGPRESRATSTKPTTPSMTTKDTGSRQ